MKMTHMGHRAALVIMLLPFMASVAFANLQHPLEPPDLESPRNTLQYFMENMKGAYNVHLEASYLDKRAKDLLLRATGCLDLHEVAPGIVEDVGIESALMLKEVLDRIELPPFDRIPDAKTVQDEVISKWSIPKTSIHIVRIEEGLDEGKFLFSHTTVARAREYYERVRHLPYKPGASIEAYEDYILSPGPWIPNRFIRNLPDMADTVVFDQALWQWAALLFTIVLGCTFIILAFRCTRPSKEALQSSVINWSWGRQLFPLLFMGTAFFIEYFIDEQINITGQLLDFTKRSLRLTFFVAFGWGIIVLGNGLTELFINSKRLRPMGIDANITRLLFRVNILIILIVLLWNASDYLGVSLAAVFASAGIAGLAIAFAARETLANFFGGVSILLDRPFKAGDYVILDSGERGEVVEVGLRSTRLLTRDDVQISIPNAVITGGKIINESAPQPRFRVRIKVGISYNSDPDVAKKILLALADKNPLVVRTPEPRVRFRRFGDSSLDFELLCWAYKPRDKGRLIHELNDSIFKAFKKEGIVIALPQHEVHIVTPPQS